MRNRMSFHRTGCQNRTDSDFRNRSIPSHHREFSILEELPIDMIKDFVTSDDLHLIHLGIMKKCLLMWKEGENNFSYKWKDRDIVKLNEMLKNINTDMPTDIHRAVRNIDCIKFWKGTEFRTFLLYIGVVVLRDLLREQEYRHFLKLYCAVILSSTDKFINKNSNKIGDLINELFNDYIEEYIELYGIEYITSNVHNLEHIHDDLLRFGNLTKISSYVFENSLAGLKLRVRNCNRPLEQISRRIIELNLDYRNPINFNEQKNEPLLKYPSDKDGEKIYNQIFFGEDFFLSSRNFGDKWFLIDSGHVVEFHFALKRQQEYLLYGSCMKNLTNYFTEPFSSKNIYTFLGYNNQKAAASYINIKNVMAKMVCLRHDEELIFMPLLHTLK